MAAHANQSDSSPQRRAGTVNTVSYHAIVAIGGTGAPTVSKSPDAAFTVTRTDTGIYALTYPKGKNVWITHGIYSPLLTVVGLVVTARDATAGTATIKTLAGTNAAAATDPASGDSLQLVIDVER